MGYLLQRPDRRRQTQTLDALIGKGLQPFKTQGQVNTALVARQRMDLIHDHRAHRAKHVTGLWAGEQEIKGFRVVIRISGGCLSIARRSR